MGEPRPHLARADDTVLQLRALADVHHLEEARNDPAVPRPADEILHLGVVLVADHDRVQLDLVEAGAERRVDPAEHARQVPAAGHAGEARGIERVERDVHALQARGAKRRGELLEPGRIRGEGEILEPERAEERDHLDRLRMQERLATGEPDTAHAGVDEAPHHRLPGIELERVLEIAIALVGAAVDAGEIAAVRQRKPDRSRRGGRSGSRLEDGEREHAFESMPETPGP